MKIASLRRTGVKLAAGSLLAAALLGAGPALAGKKDDTIRFATDQAPESVDPFFNNVRIGVILGAQIWDTLVYRDPKTNEYKGNLAKSWKQIDERTIEFELREGVKFHNGEAFDADSVVYTLNFVANRDNKVTTQQNVNWIEKAEKLGQYKVRVVTKKVFPAAIEYLAGPRAIRAYRVVFVSAVIVGAMMKLEFVWNFSDLMNGMMAIPNLIALLMLSKIVKQETERYFKS